MKKYIYQIALMSAAAMVLAACTSAEDTALEDAIASGTVVPATIGSVSIEGRTATTTAKAATRAVTTTQPNNAVTAFQTGDVFKVYYNNTVISSSPIFCTSYAQLQTDNTWKTFADEACTTAQTVYLDANNETSDHVSCFYQGYKGDTPEGLTKSDDQVCYISQEATADTRGSLVCYDALRSYPQIQATQEGNSRRSSLMVNFSHANYLLMLNIAKAAADKSNLREVSSVTVGLKGTRTIDNEIRYYDVAASSTAAPASADGITAPQWRVILPPYLSVGNDGYYTSQVSSITVKGKLTDNTDWTYTIDLEKSGQTFAPTSNHSRTANVKVSERLTLSLGATLEGWTAVDKGAADISDYTDVYDFTGLTDTEINSKIQEISAYLKTLPAASVRLVIKGLKTLPESALYNINSLASVSLPDATTIGVCAFLGCTNLASVSLPVAETINQSAFAHCTSLARVSLPKAATIDVTALWDCTNLASISLPKATTIGIDAFSGCTNLTSISLPVATTIAIGAFSGCTNLTSVSLPVATTIDIGAFTDCKSLASISLPVAETINQNAFGGCTSLASISLPKATTIGVYPFNSCTNLTSLTLSAAGNMTISSEAWLNFEPNKCTLTLNSDKKSDATGSATPKVQNGLTWSDRLWKSISYVSQ